MACKRRTHERRQTPPCVFKRRREEGNVLLPVAIRHGRYARRSRFGHEPHERFHRQTRNARSCGIYQNSRQRSNGKGRCHILRHPPFFKRVFNQSGKGACQKRHQRLSFRHGAPRAYVLFCNPSLKRDCRRYDHRIAQPQDLQRIQSLWRRRSADVARIDG